MAIKRVVFILATVGFISITVAVLSAWNSPATGYESSIYWSTPPLVWGCLIFSIVCGIAIIVHQVYRRDEHSNIWVTGFILLLLTNTVILSLHIIRGYAMWNASGDTGTHLGIIQELVSTGSFSYGELFEPATHIYLAQLTQILDVSPTALVKLTPVFFALLYMVFMYFLAKSILHNKYQILLVTVAATALMFGSSLIMAPNALANLILPMTLYFLFKSYQTGKWQYKAMFILMLLLLPVFHELATAAIAIILLTIPVMYLLTARLSRDGARTTGSSIRFSIISLIILVAGVGVWLLPKIIGSVDTLTPEGYLFIPRQIEGPLIPSQLPADVSHFTVLTTKINYAAYYGYSIVVQFFKIYGGTAVFALLTLVTFPVIWKAIRKGNNNRDLASLLGPLAIFTILIIGLLFSAVHFGPLRFVFYVLMICTIFAGFMLYTSMNRVVSSRSRRLVRITGLLIPVLLIAVSINAVFTVYPSPYTLSPSYHTTRAEIDGMDWFLHNKDTAISSSGWYYAPRRYAAFLLTSQERAGREDFSAGATTTLPFHLGYDQYSTMGEAYEEDTYVVFRELNRRTYVDLYPGMAELRLLPGDLIKMENDTSVGKLYDNSGMDIWYVHTRL